MLPALAIEPLDWLGTGRGLALALHLGLLTVCLAYWLYGWGLRTLSVPTAMTLTLAEPLTAAVLGVAMLGERLGPIGWLGAGAVAAGLVTAGRGERSGEPRPAGQRGREGYVSIRHGMDHEARCHATSGDRARTSVAFGLRGDLHPSQLADGAVERERIAQDR